MSEQAKQLQQQRDPDETWSVPIDDLDATWPTRAAASGEAPEAASSDSDRAE